MDKWSYWLLEEYQLCNTVCTIFTVDALYMSVSVCERECVCLRACVIMLRCLCGHCVEPCHCALTIWGDLQPLFKNKKTPVLMELWNLKSHLLAFSPIRSSQLFSCYVIKARR